MKAFHDKAHRPLVERALEPVEPDKHNEQTKREQIFKAVLMGTRKKAVAHSLLQRGIG